MSHASLAMAEVLLVIQMPICNVRFKSGKGVATRSESGARVVDVAVAGTGKVLHSFCCTTFKKTFSKTGAPVQALAHRKCT